MTGQEKCDLLNADDCLIEMTAWAALTVHDLPLPYLSSGTSIKVATLSYFYSKIF